MKKYLFYLFISMTITNGAALLVLSAFQGHVTITSFRFVQSWTRHNITVR